jgi:predicted MPP superfamily phosphohydrolase
VGAVKKRWALLALFVALAAAGLYGWRIEPLRFEVTRLAWPPALAQAFAGQRVVYVSDLHVTANWRKADKLLALLRRLAPDYLLLGGDLVTYEGEVEPVVEFLKRLPPTKGAYALLGDSDYMGRVRNCAYCHVPGRRELRDDVPVRFLRNETVDIHDGRVRLVGLDGEDKAGWHDVCRDGIQADTPTLVMAHYPEAIAVIAPFAPAQVLAGDTHGGQVALPVWMIDKVAKARLEPYRHGPYHVRGTRLFVSRGVGESLLPIRLGERPEVVIFEASP